MISDHNCSPVLQKSKTRRAADGYEQGLNGEYTTFSQSVKNTVTHVTDGHMLRVHTVA